MEKEYNYFSLIAIVAIVAIVGLVVLIISSQRDYLPEKTSTSTVEPTEGTNVVGQAGGISKPINSPKDCEPISDGKNFGSGYTNRVLNLCWGTYYFPNGISISGTNITINCGGGVTLVDPYNDVGDAGITIKSGHLNKINYCITQNYSTGYNVTSSDNSLIGNTAKESYVSGFYVNATNTYLYNNRAQHNELAKGFYIQSSNNYLWNNLAEYNYEGFFVSDYNYLYDNLAQYNNETGFYIYSYFNNVTKCTARRNTGTGFIISGSYNTFNENAAEYNTYGFDILGVRNSLTYNSAYKNQYGIILNNLDNDLTGNNIDSNIVVGLHMHDPSDGTDLRDNLICNNPIDIKCENSGPTTWNNDQCNIVQQTGCGFNSCPRTCLPASGCGPCTYNKHTGQWTCGPCV